MAINGNNSNQTIQLQMPVYASLLAALTAVGAYLAIPVGPVPRVLQNLFILLAGILLGSRWATVSVAIYLLMGALGLPVFAGGTGGIGRFVGPTGGYLVGFLPAVFIIGLIAERFTPRVVIDIVAMVVGSLMIYACGIFWLKSVTGMSWIKALSVGMLPFLIGDALKILAAAAIAKALRPIIRIKNQEGSGQKNPHIGSQINIL